MITASINKMLKTPGKATKADVTLMFMRLILLDPEKWTELFKIYFTEQVPAIPPAPPIKDPYDRGGR